MSKVPFLDELGDALEEAISRRPGARMHTAPVAFDSGTGGASSGVGPETCSGRHNLFRPAPRIKPMPVRAAGSRGRSHRVPGRPGGRDAT